MPRIDLTHLDEITLDSVHDEIKDAFASGKTPGREILMTADQADALWALVGEGDRPDD